MVHDMYLFQVKSPAESKGAWDYYNLKGTIKGDDAFQSLALSRCAALKKYSKSLTEPTGRMVRPVILHRTV
jgi:uncharacterized membrane protein